ncbi:hypothetical protein BU24DRAFT_459258 [Aaosphaeria arxii CBS 175.79]|uniref:Cyclin-like domain-containing protein n=1 Tax=Aaosphaeria arxii CBS 175.79 TaxID=1450172 RepID=A0A6A5Y401_9PLEO|nr:uncharacterized protein BU24DRAFT_459258 [Aaosphaeria arxii CBS 175.79]KAF2019601.1 hypothetical protein BU24DRAFT_459258 [Aaosphaeria arxii CBS 175.79]
MPGPVTVPRVKAPRLQSLNNPASVPTYTATRNKPSARPNFTAPSSNANAKPKKYVCCDSQEISIEDDGSTLCYSCGRIFSSDSNIVSEVTFGENAAGGAVVQGAFVGENQRHANTMGGTARGLGGIASREQTEWKGKSEIQKLCGAMNIRLNIEEQAFSLYKLALSHNFVQGRRVRNVAAISIYLASRRQPDNTLLLMDLSEKIQVNVWKLGDTYKQFLQTIMMEDPENVQGMVTIQQIEPLMLKFCRKLEFEEAAYRVAEDACKILRRMKRDWMVQGRQPAGLCGACIILAARMNNYRRTVREVVYVVKVADSTINQRLYEFKQTKSSQLTVNQFREFGLRVKDEIMPPSIWRREQKEERKRKKLRQASGEDEGSDGDDDIDYSGVEDAAGGSEPQRRSTRKKRKTPNNSAESTGDSEASSSREPRRDEDGFVIPDVPGDADLLELEDIADAVEHDEEIEPLPLKKRRGRPPKKREPIIIPDEDLEIEADLEEEVSQSLVEWDKIFKVFKDNEAHPILVAAGAKATAIASEHRPDNNIPETEDIEEDEFEHDEEVMNCLNTPDEIRIKERLWVAENEDWLREQQRKNLAKELEEVQNKGQKQKQKRRHRQMGDGSLLQGRQVSGPAEAATLMMQERAKGSKFSQHIDYAALLNLVGKNGEETPGAAANVTGASPAASSGSERQKPDLSAQQQQPEPAAGAAYNEAHGEQEEYEEDYNDQYDEEGNFIDPGHYEEDEYNYDDDF